MTLFSLILLSYIHNCLIPTLLLILPISAVFEGLILPFVISSLACLWFWIWACFLEYEWECFEVCGKAHSSSKDLGLIPGTPSTRNHHERNSVWGFLGHTGMANFYTKPMWRLAVVRNSHGILMADFSHPQPSAEAYIFFTITLTILFPNLLFCQACHFPFWLTSHLSPTHGLVSYLPYATH